MKPFNQLFGENAGNPITVDGVTIYIAYRIVPEGKTKLNGPSIVHILKAW